MKARISMNDKDLFRFHELKKVHEKRQTLAQTTVILGLSLRQVRLSKRLKIEGPTGLIQGLLMKEI
jgi:hypothetical protein